MTGYKGKIMRILDTLSASRLEDVIIYLKKDEAIELIGALEAILNAAEDLTHCHVNDSEYAHEITVTLYNENNLNGFDQRSRELILEDK